MKISQLNKIEAKFNTLFAIGHHQVLKDLGLKQENEVCQINAGEYGSESTTSNTIFMTETSPVKYSQTEMFMYQIALGMTELLGFGHIYFLQYKGNRCTEDEVK
ncbi:hypothetical protein Y1Q_0017968 [Alligator mississippiensis]|uniref:Uncharacterized protein n=1 Tax=Alligator mississippiensis TaxID=8496 RepID=A0A151MXQ2_ALLMI|nr:hypothetical protein Y1Q_0017968 [Alligator mississippiensis]